MSRQQYLITSDQEAEKLRTVSMNRQQWPILIAFSKQRKWPIYGEYQYIDEHSWKHILTAAFFKEINNETPPMIAAGFSLNTPDNIDPAANVMLGYHTSKITEKLWPKWIAFLNAAAAECEVKIPVSKRVAKQYQQ